MKEKWKKINGWPYKISNLGRVKRTKGNCGTRKGKILKFWLSGPGHSMVTLSNGSKHKKVLVHRLVAHYFIGLCPEDKEVNHKDGNKENPYVDNLEYVTSSENLRHAYKTGLRTIGEDHCKAKLKDKEIKEIRKLYKTGKYFQREIAERFHIAASMVSRIVRYKTRKVYVDSDC